MKNKDHKILIVDDDPTSVQTMTDALIEDQFVVFATTKSQSAVKIALDAKPDLIISDWDMPDMNGIELIEELCKQETTARIPIIIVTGVMLDDKNLSSALKIGAVDYIRKPLSKIELKARVGSMLTIIENQRIREDQQQRIFTQEQIIFKERQKYLEEENEQKRKQLAASTMKFASQNKLLASVAKDIKEIKKHTNKEGTRLVYNLLVKLNHAITDSGWKEFENSFENLHSDFIRRLTTNYPDLTPNEKRLCAFIRMGMQTKDISGITQQSANSIDVARHRLRKKIKIKSDDDLLSFLINY